MPETVVHFQIRMPPDLYEKLASWAKRTRFPSTLSSWRHFRKRWRITNRTTRQACDCSPKAHKGGAVIAMPPMFPWAAARRAASCPGLRSPARR